MLRPHSYVVSATYGLRSIGSINSLRSCTSTRFYATVQSKEGGDGKRPKRDERWTKTLNLPKTPFEIRAYAQKRELLFRKRTTTDLYRWQASQVDRTEFILHDGPPYANGELHVGHALNKILKDVINRYQVMIGNRVHYMPGWDCHGLPIENKVFGSEEFKNLSPTSVSPDKVRKRAASFAQSAITNQLESFKKYGIMADWSADTTYRTFDKTYIRRQMRIMREMVRKGLIYRAHRPVFWSPSSRSALAEAEIEYDENYVSSSAYVRFPIIPGSNLLKAAGENEKAKMALQEGLNAIIWTTTPWTLPSNMAMNINRSLLYSIVQPSSGPCKGEYMLIAHDLINHFESLKIGRNETEALLGKLDILLTVEGEVLLDSSYRHPYLPKQEPSRPILAASYVTADSGSGLVHSAPGHGKDDYNVWQEYCKSQPEASKEVIISPIDDSSCFTSQVRDLSTREGEESLFGLPVLSKGTKKVVEALFASGDLLTEMRYKHRYLIDWRTSKPIIVRCTSQWFANVESIKAKALASLDNVLFTPSSGKTRLQALLQKRNEWCISRQRVWGVPIPVVYNSETDEPLFSTKNMEHIENILMEKGIDYWWQGDAEEFVEPSERKEGVRWRKGEDIVDVWFDSGSSWTLLPGAKDSFGTSGNDLKLTNKAVADVYLEGTDQHRGWFQSSLLTYIAMANGEEINAPYKNVITHGFIIDKKGEKMSKSRGNVMSPNEIIEGGTKNNDPAYGTDVLRFWATRADAQSDIAISSLIIKKSFESMQKIRNTCRFILGVIPSKGQAPELNLNQMDILDRYILNRLIELEEACRDAYDRFDFAEVTQRISSFCNSDISSLYLGITKDKLYSDPIESPRRQATVAVLDQTLRTLLSILSPILPHLAEEVYHFYKGAQSDPSADGVEAESVFQMGWQNVPKTLRNESAQAEFEKILGFRDSVLALLEQGRQKKLLTSSYGVDLDLLIHDEGSIGSLLRKNGQDLADIFMVSHVNFVDSLDRDIEQKSNEEWLLKGTHQGIEYTLRPSKGEKCPRCWTHRKLVEEEGICKRCQEAVAGH